eukprot:SAG31_NODE_154_length_22184_cov_25.917142_13_plen_117_part_00
MVLSQNGSIDEFTVEQLKQQIEDSFINESTQIEDEFRSVDSDKDGFINVDEFSELVRQLGAGEPTKEQLEEQVQVLSTMDMQDGVERKKDHVSMAAFVEWWEDSDGRFIDLEVRMN